MEMFLMHWGRIYASHPGFPYFSLPNPTLTSISDPSNGVFDDDVDRVSDDKAALANDGELGGEGDRGGDVGHSGASFEGDSNLPGGSDVVLLEEEEYTPPLTHSHTGTGSSSFDATYFYHYMHDHFSRLNLRLDALNERQQQCTQNQHELLRQQMEFDCRQCNLEHDIHFAYEHHRWPCPPPDWRPSGPLAHTNSLRVPPSPFVFFFACFTLLHWGQCFS